MLLYGIHHQRQLVSDSAKKKFYSIVGTDLESEALVMHTATKVMAKLGSVTNQAKYPKKPRGKKKEQF